MLKSGQTWNGVFVTLDATGALSAATVGPAGALYVDGVLNGAGVTIAGANPYSFSVTLPAMTAGQSASVYITATVGGIATAAVVAFDQADTKLVSDLNDLAQADILSDATPFAGGNVDAAISTRGTANAGDAMALTGVALTDIEDAVWDTPIVDHLDAGSTGEALNGLGVVAFPTGAISYTYTVTNSVTTLPVEGVDVWASTDLAGTNIIWRGTTDAFGVARDINNNLPALDAGTYYFWKQKSGFVTTNPDPEVVV